MSQPSSPVLKARRQTHKLYSQMLYSILCFCVVVWLIRSAILHLGQSSSFAESENSVDDGLSNPVDTSHDHIPLIDTDILRLRGSHHSIATQSSSSLTIILPVTTATIADLDSLLHSLLYPSGALVEVILLSFPRYHPQIRKSLRTILSKTDDLDLEFSVSHWHEDHEEGRAALLAAQRATTDWVLLTDAEGLRGLDVTTRNHLLLNTPPQLAVPIGPRGILPSQNGSSCLVSSSLPQQAKYLVPPLVLPTSLLPDTIDAKYAREPWTTLGEHIARATLSLSGGTVLGSPHLSPAWCLRHQPSTSSPPLVSAAAAYPEDFQFVLQGGSPTVDFPGSFLILLYGSDVRYVATMACSNARRGHRVNIIALYDSDETAQTAAPYVEGCPSVTVHNVPSGTLIHSREGLHGVFTQEADVVLSAVEEDIVSWLLAFYAQVHPPTDSTPTDIRVPREDLPYCDWMTTVDLGGWKNWHVPQIELSVITDNRPHSLRRLLSSLTRARYFGDALNLRINIEQTADEETLRLVSDYEWAQGETFLHHRIVHGGLMTAVVESWYPQGNDSYGLILEDDVELSPLFYAWIKMSLLRYRYGRPEDRDMNLFGISLYQQKNLELRPEGRHLFDARATFTSVGLAHPNTPYLSQIPCSWGALYFPEQWREFHTYLTARLSSAAFPLSEPVAQELRSNRWTRSWKKYFIELVYLRGYVMLYPNYAGFASLSTNHLETGSHVREMPAEAHARKKKLFNVPLMPLPPTTPSAETRTGLLELPHARLPGWNELPVLDLLGTVVDEEILIKRGRKRRTELTGCDGLLTEPNNVRELLCIH